ncbi:MAG: cytochrome P450 [Pseudonocardiaceae bacterium]
MPTPSVTTNSSELRHHHQPFATHRNPSHWDRPEAFDPSRFGAEGSSDYPRAAYYPFGMGQRMCIGSTLSLVEQQLTIVTVAQAYRRELVAGYELAAHYDVALRPRDGVPMRCSTRRRRGTPSCRVTWCHIRCVSGMP